MTSNDTMMQYFEWYLPSDSTLWKKATKDAIKLSNLGISYIWLPPAYKAAGGKEDVGYGVYDLYDLGEFDQKGSVATKYGTKDEYLEAIRELKNNNIKVLADVVLNHKLGADETEEVIAVQDDSSNRNVSVSDIKKIRAWTKYTFPGRGDTYSDYKWDWTNFHGVDWDEETATASIYKFYGKKWDKEVDDENGNFDYLMGADIDLNNADVIKELKNWGLWYYNFTGVDGFRLDAVKHIRADFFPNWLGKIREVAEKNLFAVGEYWSLSIDKILSYMEKSEYTMNLFDVPLHYNFFNASRSNGEYDMRKIFDGTLLSTIPDRAVTFVDNHDTEPGQALESWVLDWFKPIAYSIILLRNRGIPCVFYGDYYGIPSKDVCPKNVILDKLLKARKYFAYGEQEDYFYDKNKVGFVRRGDYEHHDSGLAVVMTDKLGGVVRMNIGKKFAGTVFYDCLGFVDKKIYIDEEGYGDFECIDGSVSVWIRDGQRIN